MLAVLMLGIMAACSHAPEQRNLRLEAATDLNGRAQNAYRRGDLPEAKRLFDSALQADRAIENTDGIAINLLSLSQVLAHMGKPAEAERLLDLLLQDSVLHYSPAHLAEGSLRKASIHLAQGDMAVASLWVGHAQDYCGNACPLAGAAFNLQAQLALRAGHFDEALSLANQGLSASRSRKNDAEAANALRIQANIMMAQDKGAEALPLLEQALVTDKALGLPDKIKMDLTLTSGIYRGMGKTIEADSYAERAKRITETIEPETVR